MLNTPAPSSKDTIKVAGPSFFERLGIKLGLSFVAGIKNGYLCLVMPDGTKQFFGDPDSENKATMFLKSYRFFGRLLRDGGMGVGESYTAGEWEADDLTSVLKMFIENLAQGAESKLNLLKPFRWLNWAQHWLRDNTRKGSKENISAHYDLSNEMFSTFLDSSMTYSSGFYRTRHDSLEVAQRNKLQRVLDKAQVRAGDHILEIGSGWGSFSMLAAKQSACKITTITLSKEQLAVVEERRKREGLEKQVEPKLIDYRDVQGKYDAIVSIEMLEAVGHRHLKTFFQKCDALLKPDGVVVIQVITMLDQWYKEYMSRTDWIQKHIFPGSHLPSLTHITEVLTKHTPFVVESVENLAPHYARTLVEWRERFKASSSRLLAMGYDEKFQKTFDYYFSSCEAEFATRTLGVVQLVLTRPNNRRMLSGDALISRSVAPALNLVSSNGP